MTSAFLRDEQLNEKETYGGMYSSNIGMDEGPSYGTTGGGFMYGQQRKVYLRMNAFLDVKYWPELWISKERDELSNGGGGWIQVEVLLG